MLPFWRGMAYSAAAITIAVAAAVAIAAITLH